MPGCLDRAENTKIIAPLGFLLKKAIYFSNLYSSLFMDLCYNRPIMPQNCIISIDNGLELEGRLW
jgi:hypothetical protein